MKGGGRKVQDGFLEQLLSQWYSQQMAIGNTINGSMIKKKAQELADQTGSKQCKFSNGWIAGKAIIAPQVWSYYSRVQISL